MNSIIFRKINANEFESAYDIICDTVEWLKTKNIRQWTDPVPRNVYERRQLNEENYALFINRGITVVLSIVYDFADHWLEEIKTDKKVHWLCTIATAGNHRGNNFGRRAISEAIKFLKSKNADQLYLDCVWEQGFLPDYYQSFGFELIHRKVINWPKCGPQEMALMRYVTPSFF